MDHLELPYPGADYVEEAGERVRTGLWREAGDAGFFAALERYEGAIHLVYGEHDRFDPAGLRQHVIERTRATSHEVTLLPGQDHSGWDWQVAQQVFEEERRFLARYL